MRYRFPIFCLVFLWGAPLFADPALAPVVSPAEVEIQHLLELMENSSCQFFRNGKVYTGAKASQHVRRKYDYFKDKIKTAEDFVRYSATKSEWTGKVYTVRCAAKEPRPLSDWLLEALNRFRAEEEGKREK